MLLTTVHCLKMFKCYSVSCFYLVFYLILFTLTKDNAAQELSKSSFYYFQLICVHIVGLIKFKKNI